jgi:uncharacterized repeat protein (TIGR01451 family)
MVGNIPKSYDPNEMAGPLGIGDPETERFVKPGEWMTYTVYFENKSDATAAAQEVRVTNPLSEWLDWSTLKMGEVAFNNQIDLGLNGKPSGSSEATMKGTNFLVRTTLGGGYDGADSIAASGVAHWYLRIVDPTTDTGWPKDILAGFLPPNDETFRGEGHLTYTIKVRDDAPANVVITNSASIVFDYNDPIETDPAWWNTVAPTVGTCNFPESQVVTFEGSNATIRVSGGNVYSESSLKLYLTYNTAAAADADLAKGAVGGVMPKGGLKFPLTLKWEAGEIGEKVVTIPVKTDKTVEDDEVFTLQLADPIGMELGEESVCTVTIHDLGYDELAAKIATGTASKSEKSAWDKLQKAKAPYIRGLANPANAGKVTGSALCAAGKKVTLKATANKGFVFMNWRGLSGTITTTPSLVIDRSTKPAASSATSTTLTNVIESATFFAEYITVEEDKAAVSLSLNNAQVARAEEGSAYQGVVETNIMCGVALNWDLSATALSATTIKVTGLPSGLKFTAKNGLYTITGAPTAASQIDKKTSKVKPSEVKVTVTTAGKSSVTYLVKLTVDPLPSWSVGNFDGPGATMAVTSAGKISGKLALSGTNWTYKADSYSLMEVDSNVTNFLFNALATASKATLPVDITVRRADSADGLLINATAEGSIGENSLKLWRGMWKDKTTSNEAKAELGNLDGLYTISLSSDEKGAYGSGYISLTVGKDGTVKSAGKLADGTTHSASSPLLYDAEDGYFAIAHSAPSAYKGGVFSLAAGFEPGTTVLKETGSFGPARWSSRNPQATGEYDLGFDRTLTFTGARYDKTKTLYDHYKALTFEAAAPELNGAYPTNLDPIEVAVDAKGKAAVPKNSGLTFSFTQSTGIFKGSYGFVFDAKTKKNVNFEGILVPGAEWLEGFYLWDASAGYDDPKTGKPKTYKYKESFPVLLESPVE